MAARLLLSCLLLAVLIHTHSSTAISTEESDRCLIQVHEHFLTLRPQQTHITVDSQCTPLQLNGENYYHCEDSFNGNYTWRKENGVANYVLFNLIQQTSLIQISLTYRVIDGTQLPKVSFCPVADTALISDQFTNDESCRKFTVEATGELETGVLELSTENETSKVVMEVVTHGIKADFKAMGVQFYGNCTTDTTVASVTSMASGTTPAGITTNVAVVEEQVNTVRASRAHSIRMTIHVLLLLGALSLIKITL